MSILRAVTSLLDRNVTAVMVVGICVFLAATACDGGATDPTATQTAGFAETPTPEVHAAGGRYVITIHLSAPTGSFQVGEAVLESVDGGTRITVDVEPPGDSAQPMHIHSGTCDDVGSVINALENVVRGHSVTTINEPITDIAAASRLINVHRSAQDIDIYTACGELPDLP